jgi:signal recognition particle receptor subunit alpha
MLDFIAVIHAGGLVLYQQYCVPSSEKTKIMKELKKFIEDVFLSQKEETKKKIGNHIFEYKFDRDTNLLYLIVYLEQFSNPKNSDILDLFSQLYNDKYYTRGKGDKRVNLVSLLEHKEELNDDFKTILDTIDFTETTKINNEEKLVIENKLKKQKEEKKNTDKKKQNSRTWDPALSSSTNTKNKKKIEEMVNYSKFEDEDAKLAKFKNQYLGTEDELTDSFVIVSSDDEDDSSNTKSVFSLFKKSISSFTTGGELKEADLDKCLHDFANALYTKNVAMDIAEEICASLKYKLLKEKSKLLTSTKTIVKNALKESITKILTPKRHIDLLSMALKKKEEGRPFIITFIGVNGVGKSTNLAKVAYMFKNNGFSVMLAACDNFRAGAVEQIKTHGRCLEVPVFERGYKDDAADIARDAIREANAKKIDVILIDTAGRMQDNAPLMNSLARLVNINSPDVVLFICEALAGGDLIDQVTKFNQSLKDMSSNLLKGNNSGLEGEGREIDGIILSKFDTVDDKVGATLSLTYSTGKPIVFIGTGQKYHHLKKLNVDMIVKMLLK